MTEQQPRVRMRQPADDRVLRVPLPLVDAYQAKGWVEDSPESEPPPSDADDTPQRKTRRRRGRDATESAGTEPESTASDESEED